MSFLNKHKNTLRKIHRWLGLSSGLVVFIVAITGCLYSFEHEINTWLNTGYHRTIEKEKKPFLSPLHMEKTVREAFGKKVLRLSVNIPQSGKEAATVWVRDAERQFTAYIINPYSGNIIDTYSWAESFWAIIIELHTSLMIPVIGHDIVAISTVIFAIMMLTGFLLWLPPKLKGWKTRLTIKWDAPFKRKNYDIHRVSAFYSSFILIFMIITGLSWSYLWLDIAIMSSIGGSYERKVIEFELTGKLQSEIDYKAVNDRIISLQKSDVETQSLLCPTDRKNTYTFMNNYTVEGLNKQDIYWIDATNGKVIQQDLWEHKPLASKIRNAYYNIHIGSVFGLTGKILWFLMTFLAATLPITGFIIWKNRKSRRSVS